MAFACSFYSAHLLDSTAEPSPAPKPLLIENLLIDGKLVPYRVEVAPGDGACLFHSIAFLVYGRFTETQAVRKRIVKYVLANWDRYRWGTFDDFKERFLTKEEYEIGMSKPDTYGTTVEITAAAEIYNIRLEVFFEGALWQWYGDEGKPVRKLRFNGDIQNGHIDVYVEDHGDHESKRTVGRRFPLLGCFF